MTLDRRKKEIELLKKKYGVVEYSPNLDWMLIKQFSLPPGWNREKTSLLILIPSGYPTTPPDNFYVEPGLKTAEGTVPSNYSEGKNVLKGKWGQFSFHVKEWSPTAEIEKGDNLLTFILGAQKRLYEKP